MTPAEFLSKWSKVSLSERSSYQQHFLDLCALVGHEPPAKADPRGEWFCFERGAEIHGGGDGWADVWKRGFFGIEYKGKHKDLGKAYDQLLKYRASLENPPLLVVCDTDRIEIHTNFTGTAEKVHTLRTADIAAPRSLELLRHLFFEPERLKPGLTSATVTKEAAGKLGALAQSLRNRGLPAQDVARFLDRVVFALFAEDVQLLPAKVFTTIVEKSYTEPERFKKLCGQLFAAMATGGDFGPESIRYFNGDLFTAAPVLDLTKDEIEEIQRACILDWGAVDPSIFGTLFQRGLDPKSRAALGAEYTGREDIELLVEPVILVPLREEWAVVKNKISEGIAGKSGSALKAALTKARKQKQDFLDRLGRVHVMDPACGSGNFLYVSLQKLKDLEKDVILFGGVEGVETSFFPKIGPWQFHGIEINDYAYELAQMTLWIGYLQWHRGNGFALTEDPVLKKLDTFHHHDALLDVTTPTNPKEWHWPKAPDGCDLFVVGNPPFLGTKKLRRELGDEYTEQLFSVYADRIPNFSDLCCYWFEKARAMVANGTIRRAGLLATQAIRGGLNRVVLDRIKADGDIFFAISTKDWLLDGAQVDISMVGFDDGTAKEKVLDGKTVVSINADLTATSDLTKSVVLKKNKSVAFIADVKAGKFDVTHGEAVDLLKHPNSHGRPNSDVVLPWINSLDVLRRPQDKWIIDFGVDTSEADAAHYEEPYRLVRERVYPLRSKVKRQTYRDHWWLHAEPCAEMRRLIQPLPRFLVTPTVAKHRVFAWWQGPTLPDHQLVVFTRDDDVFFGLLQSRFHELWALRRGTRLEDRPRYTPTTSFQSFPFPKAATQQQFAAIAEATRSLDAHRVQWLNPDQWVKETVMEFLGSTEGPWARFIASNTINSRGIGLVRYPRIEPADEKAAVELKKRTLTNLYNAKPAWLVNAHGALNAAVATAYGCPSDISDDDILSHLLQLNQQQSE